MPRSGSLSKRKATTAIISSNSVILYTRASTDQQENSIHGQIEAATSFATTRDLKIMHTVEDLGTSAVKHDFITRPAVIAMLRYAEKHGINHILIHKPDRAFRSSYDMCTSIATLADRGIYIRLITPELDLSTPIGKMTIAMLTAVAELEISSKSERVDSAYESLRNRRISRNGSQNHGNNPNTRPSYGWTESPTSHGTNARGKPIYKHLPDPAEQCVLSLILHLHSQAPQLHGILSIISRNLNQQGIPSPSAGRTLVKKGGIPYTASHEWTPAKVVSVIEHAVLATTEELPAHSLPTIQEAALSLHARLLTL